MARGIVYEINRTDKITTAFGLRASLQDDKLNLGVGSTANDVRMCGAAIVCSTWSIPRLRTNQCPSWTCNSSLKNMRYLHPVLPLVCSRGGCRTTNLGDNVLNAAKRRAHTPDKAQCNCVYAQKWCSVACLKSGNLRGIF
jgi:hypothetical protein